MKDDKGQYIWIQFKLEKLPVYYFTYDRVGHDQKICVEEKAMVFPGAGKAVRKYGAWLKVELSTEDCFSKVIAKETRNKLKALEITPLGLLLDSESLVVVESGCARHR